MFKENVLLWFVAKSVGPAWTYTTSEIPASPFTFLKEVNRITQTKLYIKIPFLGVGTDVHPSAALRDCNVAPWMNPLKKEKRTRTNSTKFNA